MGQLEGIPWFDLIQSVGTVAALLFSVYTLRRDITERKISLLNATVDRHREIWKFFADHPNLARVLDPRAELIQQPVTREEEAFVMGVIIHLDAVFQATKAGMLEETKGVRMDIKEFFAFPVVRAVWETSKIFRGKTFINFVERNTLDAD